jgi:hypothetical protein
MKRSRTLLIALAAAHLAAAGEVTFKKVQLDATFHSEGVATGDVNHDGKLDVLAGDVWYAAPDWQMHEVRKPGTYNPKKGYSQCFQNFAADLNGDGWVDSIIVNWPGKKCAWYENPKNKPGHWTEHLVAEHLSGETPLFADLLGNGQKVLIGGILPQQFVAWLEPADEPTKPWTVHRVSEPKNPSAVRYTHGYGCGDINGDGRKDILCTRGWWEAPEDRTQSPWPFHPAKLGPACADMIVHDFDGDGDADVLTSSAHRYGVWWFEQVKTDQGTAFRQHEIDKTTSQTHAVILADLNRDGVQDLVTGKRHYAHSGKDPGGKDPAMVFWYEVQRPAKGQVHFVRHDVDDDSGIGTQFEVRDMNDDGKLDIITSNKKGVHVFWQQ